MVADGFMLAEAEAEVTGGVMLIGLVAMVQGSGPGARLHGVLLTDLIPVKIRTTSRRELNSPQVL